ncbi:diadenosine tetraphosphatase ApaH/serine/threonine PP2A family protein phosphatase [Haloferula luteola]|uniref:Diadenosine tetraphosphatase ApaH/serine/threonine PP2A family protein phosphatase n=1 Tax=Haloferula luteola TaxID=595692 RepID=A0A840V771_9BACT|nr:metallophosphoesterase family protein [Haloferula luteola]MBB5353543.1 diadenosine tetraphosphatase ApaH/serine/threonine PP2A family protein phosphatase [Haloferula luteola]
MQPPSGPPPVIAPPPMGVMPQPAEPAGIDQPLQRIALFGDIHANLEGLQTALADSQEQGCDSYICMGDIVGYNADPAACLEIVRDMGCPVVKGNHDEDASGDHSLDSMNPVAAAALEWTRQQLSDEQRTWLRRLRMVRQIADFTVVHSTLDQPANWNYVTNRFDAMSNFSYQFTQVCFHGHTHVPRVYVKTDKVVEVPAESVVVEPGQKYFINVGSVGQPRDGDWRACYAIYDIPSRTIVFRRLEYDIRTTQEKIRAAGLPEMLAERLADGR